MQLSEAELRVLGCLVEKQATTPEHYPLTTNALRAACNQKSNRHPIVDYSDRDIEETMLLLRPAGLARTITGGRASKHKHVLDEALGLDHEQMALLAVLMLRGPQTANELRTRTERYVAFESVAAVERVLGYLAIGDEPLVTDLGRAPGQSQNRWAHLMGAERPTLDDVAPASSTGGGAGPSTGARLDQLEARVRRLEEALGLASNHDSDA